MCRRMAKSRRRIKAEEDAPMKITIEAPPNEIAALISEIQERQDGDTLTFTGREMAALLISHH